MITNLLKFTFFSDYAYWKLLKLSPSTQITEIEISFLCIWLQPSLYLHDTYVDYNQHEIRRHVECQLSFVRLPNAMYTCPKGTDIDYRHRGYNICWQEYSCKDILCNFIESPARVGKIVENWSVELVIASCCASFWQSKHGLAFYMPGTVHREFSWSWLLPEARPSATHPPTCCRYLLHINTTD